jgi:hypothetical protein
LSVHLEFIATQARNSGVLLFRWEENFKLARSAASSRIKQPQLLVLPVLRLVPVTVSSAPHWHVQFQRAWPFGVLSAREMTVNLPIVLPVMSIMFKPFGISTTIKKVKETIA